MSIENRPYAGNWKTDIRNKYRKVVSWTPDCIVKFNGETSLAGCRECNNQIDFQAFITSVNVSGSLDTLSSDISMSIPKHYGDSLFQNGAFLFQTGIEVHIYYRGFFLTSNLSESGDTFKDTESGGEYDLSKVQMRPYYPVFHGVVTSVSYSYGGGFYNASLSCASMLHFWEYQKINTNAAYMASAPTESRGTVRLDSHVYTNMTPHQIIYDLYRDTGGSADGLEWTWSSKSNVRAKTSGGTDYFSLAMRYWERRFSQGMYGLRMFGASGRIFSATEQAFMTNLYRGKRLDKELLSVQKATLDPSQNAKTSTAFARASNTGAVAKDREGNVNRHLDIRFLSQASEKDKLGVLTTQLKSFVTDYGAIGNISLFTTSYESKLQIAKMVSEKTGYEFYQDFDGDLVFKPPMYNMDTSSSRVYRIKKEDIVDLSFSHNEPEATYVICKGGPFRNQVGTGMEGEFGVRSTYVDYRLVAKYGWKPFEFDTTFYNTREQAYYAAVVKLDEVNKSVNTANLTIPLRPEIKMGYPIYVEHIDTYYYVSSVNHSFTFGGACTTSLELVARRKKFIPSGDPRVPYTENSARAIDLERTFLPPKTLYKEEDGFFRSTGFPNVVMALDTTKLDPSFLYFPIDYTLGGTSNPTTKKLFRNMILMEGYRLKVIKLKNPNEIFEEDGVLKDVFFNGPWVVTLPDPSDDTQTLETEISLDNKGRFEGENALNEANKQVVKDRKKASLLNKKGKFSESKKAREKAQIEYDQAIQQIKSLSEGGGQLTIIDLIDAIKYASSKSGEGIPNAGSTSSLISLLSNKKSSFNPNQPGYYRFYSSSHPNEDSQAPEKLSMDEEGNLTHQKVYLERADATANNMVIGIGGDKVEFRDISPSRGLLTKTLYDNAPKVTPTKDILTLSFMKNEVVTYVKRSSLSIDKSLRPSEYVDTLEFNLDVFIERNLKQGITVSQLESKIFKAKRSAKGTNLKSNGYALHGAGGRLSLSLVVKQTDIPSIAKQTALNLFALGLRDYSDLSNVSDEGKLRKALSDFISDLRRIFRSSSIYTSTQVKRGKTRSVPITKSFMSPIFPISDENGYEVFGSYQYGRGLDILPNNTFDQLAKVDPTRVFTEDELNEYLLDLYRKGKDPKQRSNREIAKKAFERLTSGVTEAQDKLERIEEISSSLGLTAKTRDQFIDQLSNAIIKKEDSQVVNNIPARRTQINPPSRGDAQCDCRGFDDDVMSELLNSDSEFLSTSTDLDSDLVLNYREEILRKANEWKRHQSALKGDTENAQNGEGLDNLFNPNITGFSGDESGFVENVERLFEEVTESVDDLNQANTNAREVFRRNFEESINNREESDE